MIFLSSGGEIFWPMAGAGIGVYLFFHGFQMLQRRRLILNTPASTIRSAALGVVEVSGLAVGPYTMPAPITSLSCYYYRTVAWEWKQSGKSSQWVKAADESLHLPFYLDDNTGRVLVDPRGAEMDIHCDLREEYGQLFSSRFEVPPAVSSFLARYGVSGDHKIKIEEYCIKPKNALFILGTLAENPGLNVSATPVPSSPAGQHAYTFSMGALSPGVAAAVEALPGVSLNHTISFSLVKGDAMPQEIVGLSPGAPVKAADMIPQGKIIEALTKAGISNPAAWAAAGVNSARVTASPGREGSATAAAPAEEFDLSPKAVLMKGANNRAFYISWRSQRDVVRSLGWKSALMIWGGPALTLACIYLLAAQFGWL